MKKIENVKELPVGTKIVRFHGGRVTYYEFLMVHPHNDKYALLIEGLTGDAPKVYIPSMENSAEWYIEFTDIEALEYQRNYHLTMANRKLERIKAKGGKV